MTSSLTDILQLKRDPNGSPLILLTSSTRSISPLPLVQHIVQRSSSSESTTLLVTALYPPAALGGTLRSRNLECVDLTGRAPSISDEESGLELQELEKQVEGCLSKLSPGPVTVILDSPATLADDLEGGESTFLYFCSRLLQKITLRDPASTLFLPLLPSSPLLPHLSTPTFSSAVTILTFHPPPLLVHLHHTYALDPSSPRVFNLIKSTTLRMGEEYTENAGLCAWMEGIAVEIISRSRKGKEGVKRSIEGLRKGTDGSLAALRWEELQGLEKIQAPSKRLGGAAPELEDSTQPTPLSTFNLSLTDSQRMSRSTVPIPYAHEGSDEDEDADEPAGPTTGFSRPGAITYEPDSGDDMDEDDPDDDLNF